VFVTLRNADGSLRGCVGTLTPAEPDVVTETARSAVLAATADPRFPAVMLGELAALRVEVSVLLAAEPAAGPADLDPARYGVIVSDGGGRQGVLLPNVEGIRHAAEQIAIARNKAGIGPGTPVALERFEVLKFVDP
jgi:AMMECR1 domain-containing protein